MVASIGKIVSASQGVTYYERDGYYARDDPSHREASAWAGKGADALGLVGPVDPDTFTAILEGRVPGGSQLGRRDRDGNVHHRPGRDVTLSAPKSVSLAALVGGDHRIVAAHDHAVQRTLAWIEANAIETRMRDRSTGTMIRAGGQDMVAATFRHDTSRNLDPQLHTHCVIANMVRGGDGKWRTMVDDGLYGGKMAIGAIYRAELAQGLKDLGYQIEKTHTDGRFELAGVPRSVIEAFSTRRAEIEAAMKAHGLGTPIDDPRLADRTALMTRAHKRDTDKDALHQDWSRQAAELGFSADTLVEIASVREAGAGDSVTQDHDDIVAYRDYAARCEYETVGTAAWAAWHLGEREAVFSHASLLAATLACDPGAITVDAAEQSIDAFQRANRLNEATGLKYGKHWTTEAALARESETIALMQTGQGKSKPIMKRWVAETKLHRGRLNDGQKEAVKIILSTRDRVIGVQGYAGTGKTTMLNRLRSLAEKQGYHVTGLAPSASAARTLEREAGIESETLQRFVARHAGIAEGRGTQKGIRNLRSVYEKTLLVVDESSLASTQQMRDLLRIATTLRTARVVLVGDEKQLDGVEAGTPFAQLQKAGMSTAVMDEIVRQRDTQLKEAVRAGLAGEVKTAFEKLGDRVSEVTRDHLGADVAERWLECSPEERESTGVIAPTRALRDEINERIRVRLIEEGTIHGPGMVGAKLVSRGMTNAEMTIPSNYAAGDTVIFNRCYKTLGVEKGDEREVAKVDHRRHTVHLRDREGHEVEWKPYLVAARKGGVEVYRSEAMELHAGDRVRFTRNDPASGLVNGQVAKVEAIEQDGARFRLEDGTAIRLSANDPQLRHVDRAWASTVHAFQGRTVDNVIAAMDSNHPHLTNQKSLYVAISRARDRAELVTDDAARLSHHLEKATGERIAALDAVKKYVTFAVVIDDEKHQDHAPDRNRRAQEAAHGRDVAREVSPSRDPEREPGRKDEHEVTRESEKRDADRQQRERQPADPVHEGERKSEPPRTPDRDPAPQAEKDSKEKKPELDFELELEL